jgi:fructose-1,6-bisphosphatase/inositol monophosphatase family enzyme
VFLAVASGTVDIVVDWWAASGPDLAGQVCIVSEAGGRFSDLVGRVDIDTEVHIVSSGVLRDGVVGRVRT